MGSNGEDSRFVVKKRGVMAWEIETVIANLSDWVCDTCDAVFQLTEDAVVSKTRNINVGEYWMSPMIEGGTTMLIETICPECGGRLHRREEREALRQLIAAPRN